MTNKKRQILVIYSATDAGDWSPYLKQLIEFKFKDTVNVDTVRQDRVPPKIEGRKPIKDNQDSSVLSRPGILVVVLTPDHVKFLMENPKVDYKQTFFSNSLTLNPENSCVVCLGVELNHLKQKDSAGQMLEKRFENLEKWKALKWENVETIIDVIGAMLKKIDVEVAVKTHPKAKILYNKVRCNKTTVLTIAFEKELPPNANVQVYLNVPESPNNAAAKTEKINPYTVIFTTKEHYEGEVNVTVMVSGNEAQLDPPATIKYVSSAGKLTNNSQIYLMFMEKMLRMALEHRISLKEIDESLASMFSLGTNEFGSIPLTAFECLFGTILDFSSKKSTHRYPTLLHFTAAHGLKELCSKLLDLPDADLALEIFNEKNKTPECLAIDAGHTELSRFLENTRMTELDDLYVVHMQQTDVKDSDEEYLRNKIRYMKATGFADAENEVEYGCLFGDVTSYVNSKSRSHDWKSNNRNRRDEPGMARRKEAAPSLLQKSPISPSSSGSRPPFKKTNGRSIDETVNEEIKEIIEKCLNGELNFRQTETKFNELKARFHAGCSTFQEKYEKTKKLKEDIQLIKEDLLIRDYENEADLDSIANFLKNASTVRQKSRVRTPLDRPPPLPSRTSRISGR